MENEERTKKRVIIENVEILRKNVSDLEDHLAEDIDTSAVLYSIKEIDSALEKIKTNMKSKDDFLTFQEKEKRLFERLEGIEKYCRNSLVDLGEELTGSSNITDIQSYLEDIDNTLEKGFSSEKNIEDYMTEMLGHSEKIKEDAEEDTANLSESVESDYEDIEFPKRENVEELTESDDEIMEEYIKGPSENEEDGENVELIKGHSINIEKVDAEEDTAKLSESVDDDEEDIEFPKDEEYGENVELIKGHSINIEKVHVEHDTTKLSESMDDDEEDEDLDDTITEPSENEEEENVVDKRKKLTLPTGDVFETYSKKEPPPPPPISTSFEETTGKHKKRNLSAFDLAKKREKEERKKTDNTQQKAVITTKLDFASLKKNASNPDIPGSGVTVRKEENKIIIARDGEDTVFIEEGKGQNKNEKEISFKDIIPSDKDLDYICANIEKNAEITLGGYDENSTDSEIDGLAKKFYFLIKNGHGKSLTLDEKTKKLISENPKYKEMYNEIKDFKFKEGKNLLEPEELEKMQKHYDKFFKEKPKKKVKLK